MIRKRPSSAAWLEVLQHPGAFALRVLKAFRKNQGLLLAGAVAYYALLSIVPLLIERLVKGQRRGRSGEGSRRGANDTVDIEIERTHRA